MIVRPLAALLLLLAAAGSAPAPASSPRLADAERLLGPLAAQLRQAQAVRGTFEQRKFLRELPRPLVARGEFLVVRGLGVSWHTREPLDSQLLLTPAGLVQRDAGREALRLSAAEQPALAEFSTLLQDLLALDLVRLDQRFVLAASGTAAAWQLDLQPREAAVAAHVGTVRVSGAAQVERVVLQEAAGDRTEIDLRGTLLPQLDAAARAVFDPPP